MIYVVMRDMGYESLELLGVYKDTKLAAAHRSCLKNAEVYEVPINEPFDLFDLEPKPLVFEYEFDSQQKVRDKEFK